MLFINECSREYISSEEGYRCTWHCSISGCHKRSHTGSSRCLEHCEKKGHGHCTFFECNTSSHYEGATDDMCKVHCKELGHGHCTWEICDRLPHHVGGEWCENHCRLENHGHCRWYDCSSAPHNDSPETEWCEKHCEQKSHKHCVVLMCGEMKHEGTMNYWCSSHCTQTEHGHCAWEMCDKQIHDESTMCTYHCIDKEHEHCSKVYCDRKKNSGDRRGRCTVHEDIRESHYRHQRRCLMSSCEKENSMFGTVWCERHYHKFRIRELLQKGLENQDTPVKTK